VPWRRRVLAKLAHLRFHRAAEGWPRLASFTVRFQQRKAPQEPDLTSSRSTVVIARSPTAGGPKDVEIVDYHR
jgi:hypothetical protein